MHNELKITDMQTLESNKNSIIENSNDENSINYLTLLLILTKMLTAELMQLLLRVNKRLMIITFL